MGRGEIPKKRRDIRTQENRDPVILEIPRIDHSHRIPRRTHVRILEGVGTRRIRVLEHVEILSPVIEVHRKSPDRKVIHRKSRFENSGIGKSRTPVTSEPYTLKLRIPRTRQNRMTVVI
jgi:hypothetical protein